MNKDIDDFYVQPEQKNTTKEEFNNLLSQIKETLEQLINNEQIQESKQLLSEVEPLINNDLDIISIKSIILIKENQVEKAESLLKNNLRIFPDSFDLVYNLACACEIQEKFEESLFYFTLAKKLCRKTMVIESIDQRINELNLRLIHVQHKRKLRIAFFVKKGLDSFINDIIRELSNEYITRKIIVSRFDQIDEGMIWADICWFEWCDELAVYGSRQEIAYNKKLICRLHSYEAFTNVLQQVEWTSIDLLIFIAKHIRNNVLTKIDFPIIKTMVIPNGIKTEDFSLKPKGQGFNIAYVGYINYKKGPQLLLHTFKEIVNQDKSYMLYIAGKFQDERYILYFRQMIQELGLEDNIHYDGWQTDLNSWLDDKDYILCSSILESQNVSVMQAMAKGIKPLIHNFVGARDIYPKKYIWNTIEECVAMISSNDNNSEEYSSFIQNYYSLSKEISLIKEALYLLR